VGEREGTEKTDPHLSNPHADEGGGKGRKLPPEGCLAGDIRLGDT